MRAGFEYYRAFPQDAIQNMNYSKIKLTMPVLALGGGYVPTFGGNITMPTVIYGMKILLKMCRVLQYQIQDIIFQKSSQIF